MGNAQVCSCKSGESRLNSDFELKTQIEAPRTINVEKSKERLSASFGEGYSTFVAYHSEQNFIAAEYNSNTVKYKDRSIFHTSFTPRNNPPLINFKGEYMDAVYLNNFYFLYVDVDGIFFTGIDSKEEPKKWIKHLGSSIMGRTLRVNKLGNHLLLSFNRETIRIIEVINDGSKGQEFYLQTDQQDSMIWDFNSLSDSKIAVIRANGKLVIHQYDLHKKKHVIIYQIMVPFRNPSSGLSLTICQHSRYFAVHSANTQIKAEKIKIFEFNEKRLKFKTEINLESMNLNWLSGLIFYGYRGDHLILTGIESGDNGIVNILTFDYNVIKHTLVELEDLRFTVSANSIHRLTKIGEEIVSPSKSGKLISIIYDS